MPRDSTRAALARTAGQAATEAKPFKSTTTVAEKGRLTVDLGAERYRDLKIAAAYAGRQVSDVVREMVDKWTIEHGPGRLP